MFKDTIRRIPLFTQDLLDNKLKKDTFAKPFDDESLYIAMVALLATRVKNLKIKSVIREKTTDFPELEKGAYNVSMFRTTMEVFDNIDNYIPKGTKLTNAENFIEKELKFKFKIRVYPEYNTVYIFHIGYLIIEAYHFVISFMPLFFPVLKEKKLTKEETDFLRSLTLRSSSHFYTTLDKLVNNEEFKRSLTAIKLAGFEKTLIKMQVDGAAKKVEDIESSMKKLMDDYSSLCDMRMEAIYRLQGLQVSNDGTKEKTEFEEYLINNKRLINVDVEGETISFIVKTYLIPYLAMDWKRVRNSSMHGYGLTEDEKMLFDSILSMNRKLKLRMCAYIRLDYRGKSVNSTTGYNYASASKSLVDYIPNTHLNRSNCFGQNKPDILSNVMMGDLIGAIECCINCAGRINIHEGPTFRWFIKSVIESHGKCFVADDGREFTKTEAIEYLKEIKYEAN